MSPSLPSPDTQRVSDLNTPIFTDGPQSRFSDPVVSWNGLADEQWNRHVLECTVQQEERMSDRSLLHEDIWHNDLYDQNDDGFDAVAAIRARLMRSKPTITTQRALEIIQKRSRLGPDNDSKHSKTSRVVVLDAEEVEDYAGDFELGDNEELLEIPATPDNSGFEDGDSTLGTIHEPDVGLPLPWLRKDSDIIPTTPVIRPVDAECDCPSFSTSDTSLLTANSTSQLIISPLVLDNPTLSSPVIYHEPFDPLLGSSPISSVSSFLFRSRRPLPTSLLDESLDIAAVMHLEIAASLRDSIHNEVTARSNANTASWGLGLGLVDVSESRETFTEIEGLSIAEPSQMENQVSRPGDTTPGIASSNSRHVELGSPFESRDLGSTCSESPSTRSPLGFSGLELDDFSLKRSLVFADLGTESLETLSSQITGVYGYQPSSPTSNGDLGERMRPYIPKAPPTSMPYTGLGSDLDTMAATVTAGSNHPAASEKFLNATVSVSSGGQVAPKVKGLGLRLPSGLKRSLQRRSAPRLPRSERCYDLASMASPDSRVVNIRHGGSRRLKILSPIPEVVSPRLAHTPSLSYDGPASKRHRVPSPYPRRSPKGGFRSFQKRAAGSGSFFKRTFKFLF